MSKCGLNEGEGEEENGKQMTAVHTTHTTVANTRGQKKKKSKGLGTDSEPQPKCFYSMLRGRGENKN